MALQSEETCDVILGNLEDAELAGIDYSESALVSLWQVSPYASNCA